MYGALWLILFTEPLALICVKQEVFYINIISNIYVIYYNPSEITYATMF